MFARKEPLIFTKFENKDFRYVHLIEIDEAKYILEFGSGDFVPSPEHFSPEVLKRFPYTHIVTFRTLRDAGIMHSINTQLQKFWSKDDFCFYFDPRIMEYDNFAGIPSKHVIPVVLYKAITNELENDTYQSTDISYELSDADMYAFGILMWEFATCDVPFKASPDLIADQVKAGVRPRLPSPNGSCSSATWLLPS